MENAAIKRYRKCINVRTSETALWIVCDVVFFCFCYSSLQKQKRNCSLLPLCFRPPRQLYLFTYRFVIKFITFLYDPAMVKYYNCQRKATKKAHFQIHRNTSMRNCFEISNQEPPEVQTNVLHFCQTMKHKMWMWNASGRIFAFGLFYSLPSMWEVVDAKVLFFSSNVSSFMSCTPPKYDINNRAESMNGWVYLPSASQAAWCALLFSRFSLPKKKCKMNGVLFCLFSISCLHGVSLKPIFTIKTTHC